MVALSILYPKAGLDLKQQVLWIVMYINLSISIDCIDVESSIYSFPYYNAASSRCLQLQTEYGKCLEKLQAVDCMCEIGQSANTVAWSI